jgi:hypothetical protein
MRQKPVRARLRFCANRVARLEPAHSRSGSTMLTAKDMSLATVSTFSSRNSAVRFG